MKTYGVLVFVALVASATMISFEGAHILLTGWAYFLSRVLPDVAPDGPSVLVAIVAVLLFGVGVHWIGRRWRRSTTCPWRLRSTGAIVVGVFVLFTAGISMIGIVHQTGWLLAAEQPLHQEGLGHRDSPEIQMKMISLGFTNFADTNGSLPPSGTFSTEGEMRHSWETQILPFLFYYNRDIDMQRAWNDPVNEKYFKCVLPEFINSEYRTPALQDKDGFGLSYYAVNQRVLKANASTTLADITDGPANTILAGEVNARFQPWGHPINSRDPAIGINRSPNGFGGPPGSGGVRFLMADGSVRFISNSIDPEVLKALSTPAGGEELGPEPWNRTR